MTNIHNAPTNPNCINLLINVEGGARSVSCPLWGEPSVPWAALFPPSLSDSSPNNALVFTWLGTIYSELEAWLGWDETSTPAKAPDLKSDPSQPPIQPVNFLCPAQWATDWTGEWEEVLDLSDVTVDAKKCCYFGHLCHLSARRFTEALIRTNASLALNYGRKSR